MVKQKNAEIMISNFFSLVLFSIAVSSSPCDREWTFHQYNSKPGLNHSTCARVLLSYEWGSQLIPWNYEEAKKACESLGNGSTLSSPTDQEEFFKVAVYHRIDTIIMTGSQLRPECRELELMDFTWCKGETGFLPLENGSTEYAMRNWVPERRNLIHAATKRVPECIGISTAGIGSGKDIPTDFGTNHVVPLDCEDMSGQLVANSAYCRMPARDN